MRSIRRRAQERVRRTSSSSRIRLSAQSELAGSLGCFGSTVRAELAVDVAHVRLDRTEEGDVLPVPVDELDDLVEAAQSGA
jgi:hypothetical protein